ncbi:MAG TPA: NADH-quinone oxidoreductase subunit NuoG [Actinomycetota bacterium]|nr:NADH-quinone oxidoreductase subunit NuoG [Actinomycetota bacterium]
MADNGLVTLTINGHEVQSEPGRILIDVAEEMGVFVPRFCYHPGMRSVAVCRMCLVKVEGQRKLLPACATPVAEGMTVSTVDEQSVDAQKGMLEFLLINHPLDCPVCDRGGECPLQDQTLRHGPGSSRYVEPKRTYEKPLEISNLVVLDRERCVLCWRCVRFADEVAGDQFIQLVERGPGTQILTFSDEPFDSYFSGNTVQICPVGALLGRPYRFVARPWDLKTAPSVCAYCSVGCPLTNEARAEKLVRCQALPNENVNDFWSCDKGRFGYHYVDSHERLDTPLQRTGDEGFEAVGWDAAFSAVADRLGGAKSVGVLAGGHLTTEDAFAVGKLAREAIGTAHVDSRIQDAGAPYELALGHTGVAGSTATLNDLLDARTIVWIGPDPKETLPVLYLRLRKAVIDEGAKLVCVSPRRISLDAFATHVVRCPAGGEAAAIGSLGTATRAPAEAASDIGAPTIVCWGPSSPGRDEGPVFEAALRLAGDYGGKVLVCPPHAGSQGMLDMGVHPGLEAGHVAASNPGRDTRAILEGVVAGDIDALVVLGADLLSDFPDAALARAALEASPFTVVVELFPTETVSFADVALPAVAYAEREGTFTNLERRIQKIEPLMTPPGSARAPWAICAGLARALGKDWGWATFADVWADIRKSVPTHAGVDVHRLAQRTPPTALNYESPYEQHTGSSVAGPGAGYPKGHRGGSPFQTGYNWPLSWELRAFEAKQRPGVIPPVHGSANGSNADDSEGSVIDRSEPIGDGFALLSGRMIYDEGAMVGRTNALREIARPAFVELSAADADRLGVADGERVLVSANGTEVELPVTVADIAEGAVFVPYHQRELRANTLMSGGRTTVEVRKP